MKLQEVFDMLIRIRRQVEGAKMAFKLGIAVGLLVEQP